MLSVQILSSWNPSSLFNFTTDLYIRPLLRAGEYSSSTFRQIKCCLFIRAGYASLMISQLIILSLRLRTKMPVSLSMIWGLRSRINESPSGYPKPKNPIHNRNFILSVSSPFTRKNIDGITNREDIKINLTPFHADL